jgi:hypothetical protein
MQPSHAVHLFLALKTDKGAPRKTRDFSSLLDLHAPIYNAILPLGLLRIGM